MPLEIVNSLLLNNSDYGLNTEPYQVIIITDVAQFQLNRIIVHANDVQVSVVSCLVQIAFMLVLLHVIVSVRDAITSQLQPHIHTPGVISIQLVSLDFSFRCKLHPHIKHQMPAQCCTFTRCHHKHTNS